MRDGFIIALLLVIFTVITELLGIVYGAAVFILLTMATATFIYRRYKKHRC